MDELKALDALLADSHFAPSHELPPLVDRHAGHLGAQHADIFLADLQQVTLRHFAGAPPEDGEPESLSVDATLAGRCYQLVEVQERPTSDGSTEYWLPLLDGTERVGVLRLVFPPGTELPPSSSMRRFATLVAELVVTKSAYGDTVVRLQRTAEVSLSAELQWSQLPPLTFACREVTVAAVLEPAYDVAGDTVDYAVDAGVVRAVVFDGMGHGLASAQISAVAVAAYRNARRAGLGLVDTVARIHEALLVSFGGASFTTALLVDLDTHTGVLRWINAGHPPALLMRDGRLVRRLESTPSPPLGLQLPVERLAPVVGEVHLQAGDSLLLYSDGVLEARSPDGEFFGERRLVDLVVRNLASGFPSPETMRRVVRALLAHQQNRLDDDATMLMLEWRSNNLQALVPDTDLVPAEN